ncbi:uncharacterized protein METZ01_LOCUS86932 [marine metagenome]|uniref:Uncharacterized protein n=1 Tax=marine metagenome TaxID=408172 RepID=A0A381V2L9_9ZZZZ
MVREYIYEIPKSDVLEHCRDLLVKLDYEIDIYASETDILITKPLKIRRALRRYDYIVFVQVTDRVEIFVAAERSVFKRGSESTVGGSSLIEKQSEDALPFTLQKRILIPIHKSMIKQKFRPRKTI